MNDFYFLSFSQRDWHQTWTVFTQMTSYIAMTAVRSERQQERWIQPVAALKMVNHYNNTPMEYAAIFKGCKIDNFQLKNLYIFLIFAQNIDCGYTLEPPQ